MPIVTWDHIFTCSVPIRKRRRTLAEKLLVPWPESNQHSLRNSILSLTPSPFLTLMDVD
jgi:hypothetical protein